MGSGEERIGRVGEVEDENKMGKKLYRRRDDSGGVGR